MNLEVNSGVNGSHRPLNFFKNEDLVGNPDPLAKKFEAPDGDPISPGTNNMRGDRR